LHTRSHNKQAKKSLNKGLPESWRQLFSGTGKECCWWNSCNKGPQWIQKRIAKH
jgi:hypothetical protein